MNLGPGLSFHVEVDLSHFNWRREQIDRFLDNDFMPLVVDSADIIAMTMKSLAPVRSGKLSASITVEQEGRIVYVGPTVDYARYVSGGTRPSPGRFVPAIGKRLINPNLPSFGMHPGIAPNRYIEETADITAARFGASLNQKFKEKIEMIR